MKGKKASKRTSKGKASPKKSGRSSRELTEKDLDSVKGGAVNAYLYVDGTKGGLQTEKWIEISSYNPATKI